MDFFSLSSFFSRYPFLAFPSLPPKHFLFQSPEARYLQVCKGAELPGFLELQPDVFAVFSINTSLKQGLALLNAKLPSANRLHM